MQLTYLRAKSVVDRPWEEKADANSDGVIDRSEAPAVLEAIKSTAGGSAGG